MVTYLDRLLPLKSHGFLITCSCGITCQAKTIIFSLSSRNQVPMTTKRGRMVTHLEELIAIKSFKHFNFVRSRDKLKPLYLHYKSTSCHQTWCEGDIPGEAPNNKVIQSFDHVILQGHVLQKPIYLYYKRLYENLTGWWLTLMGFYL